MACCQEQTEELSSPTTAPSNQQILQGYDYDFVPPLESKYECAICLMCQKDPVQTTCGHRFCRECILTWIRNEKKRCPEDNYPLTEQDVFPDNFAKREIIGLKVRCPNTKNGCQIIMELGKIEEHRQLKCAHEMISCPNGCPVTILVQDENEHVTKECLHRVIECSLCYAQFQLNQQQSHFETCPMVSIPCQHCGINMPRQEHIKHLRNDCPKAVIMCPFADIGCDFIIHPDLLQQHLSTHVHQHLRHLSSAHNQLHAVVNQLAAGSQGDSVAVGERLPPLKSLRDALQILNINQPPPPQQQPSPHQQQETGEKGGPERKISADEGLLKELFQRNIQLEQRHREQEIKYATLNQRLSEVEAELTFLREQNSDFEGRFCNGVYVWRVPGISNLVAEASHSGHSKLLHSPGFYTGAFGYKLCLRLNVIARTTTAYLSLFIHFMQGDYDDTLDWPFKGVITLALIESRQGQGDHHSGQIVETMTTKPGLAAFQRPTSDRNPKGFGFTEFVSLESLNRGFYLNNDSLIVRSVVTVEPNL